MSNDQDRTLGEKQRDGDQGGRDGDYVCQKEIENGWEHKAEEDDEAPDRTAMAAQPESYCHSNWASERRAANVDMAANLAGQNEESWRSRKIRQWKNFRESR